MSRVLVLSPHPDDEAIGCGGTLRMHAESGDVVKVYFLTSGEHGGHGRGEAETRMLREREAAVAAEILGIASFEFWRERDGGLLARQRLVDRLRLALLKWRPETVYVTHGREMHRDHRAAARLLRRALAAVPLAGRPAQVRQFEVWTPLQRLDEVIDISPYIEAKVAAIRAYGTQCAAMDFVEASLGLSRYRGEFHSWPGGDYAEVYADMTL